MLNWGEDKEQGRVYPGVRKAVGQKGEYRIACVSMGQATVHDPSPPPYAYSLSVRPEPGRLESAVLLKVIACVPGEQAERQKAYAKLRQEAEGYDGLTN